MIDSYLKKIKETYQRGDAREESYYSILEDLINNFSEVKNKQNIFVTSQPKKTDAGNPDFRIWDGKQKIVGYIEAKAPDKNLDDFKNTDQIKRYSSTFPNFILTNFLEFRLYKDGVLIDNVQITDHSTIYSYKGLPSVKNEESFLTLLEKFFSFSIPNIKSAKHLAIELAKRTRFLRDEVIEEEIREEENNGSGTILGFYEAFQTYLIRGLTKKTFANLYSQTITYGLFASRMRNEGEFNRKLAIFDIPHNIGILRDIFEYISLGDPPTQLEWIVDEISNVLASVDVKKIFSEFHQTGKGKDPVYHFYETFLAEYDPDVREQRGVYYTPESAVSYIVRSINILLKEKFGLSDGLADENVTVLDPGGGTLTFIAKAIQETLNEFIKKYGVGGKEGFIKEHILKNFYSFELMVAPYTIGHLKISYLLEELGYKLKEDERIKFYITNTLEEEEIEQTQLPGMASLAEESRKAGEVKNKIPILVILGNPPYSGISANMGGWITNLIEDYKYVDGEHFGERKHWLHDDYVKFIRFAEKKINDSGRGIIGYITNHNYLDNITFRGMRQHLMNSFDEIFVLDLHGDVGSKEQCPDGGKDENIFDIRQGVSISFFIKTDNQNNKRRVLYSERWGSRELKYEWLSSNDFSSTNWKEINPHSPSYYFIPRSEKYELLYNRFWKVTDIFPVTVTGVITSRDKFVIDFEKSCLKNRIEKFRDTTISDKTIRENFKLNDSRGWELKTARQKLIDDVNWGKYFSKILYRPFDERFIYYTPTMIDWGRQDIMKHMQKDNLALLAMRQVSLGEPYTHFLISEHMVDNRTFLSSRGTLQFFPIFLYENSKKTPNVSSELLNLLKETYGNSVDVNDLLYYIYAVFYSDVFREKYYEFLIKEFPKIPITTNYDLFIKLGKLGEKLVNLHLMKSDDLNVPVTKFQGAGENTIDKPIYDQGKSRIYINETQYFENIKIHIWEYQLGGYQVLHKWLKDRKKRKLSFEEIKHYCKIVTAISSTIKIQKEIDKLYPKVEKKIIDYVKTEKNSKLTDFEN